MSVLDVNGRGVLAVVLVSSVNRHGIVSVVPTDTELLPAVVDGHGVVTTSSLPVTVMSIPDVDGHGMLPEMFLSWDDQHGVLSILLVFTEVTAACVDGQGVVSLSPVVEDMSVSYTDGHWVTVTMLVSSAEKHGVLSTLLTATELTAD